MREAHQLSILPERHEIALVPVPPRFALAPERVWIVMRRRTDLDLLTWHVPAQWTPHEAASLIHEIKGVMWQLGEEGRPRDYEEIKAICEQFCKGKYL